MVEKETKTKTIKGKDGETITVPENTVQYLDVLKNILKLASSVEDEMKDMADAIQSIDIPAKSEELEMENSSIVIYISTAMANVDKIKTAAKNAAKVAIKKTRQ